MTPEELALIRLLSGVDVDLVDDAQVEAIFDGRTYADGVNIYAAAADVAGAAAAKLSRRFDFSEEQQNFQVSQQAEAYRETERDLRKRQGIQSVQMSTVQGA